MKKILVVDDESYFGALVKATLDPKKYTILLAKDGEEGLKMIGESSPDAVLLDINMPKMGGIEVLKRIDPKKIPVLITSNLSSKEVISEGIALGARGYIIKSNESTDTIASSIEELFVERKKV